MENDRRDDPQRTSTEHSPQEEPPRRDWDRGAGESREYTEEPSREFREPRPDHPPEASGEGGYEQRQEGYESAPPPAEGEGRDPGQSGPPGQQGQPGQMGGNRGRRRGGRGRLPPRDRRMQRNRGGGDRDRGGQFHRPGTGRPEDNRSEEPRYSDLPPEQRSLIQQAKAEVERIRETLERVLRDLEHVSDQLTKAEHEKDVAEAEIEQLRDQLRRLHR